MEEPRHVPRDRRVVLLIAALAAGVLLASVASALLPGADGALAAMPVVVLVLVVGTVLVLVRSLLGRGGQG